MLDFLFIEEFWALKTLSEIFKIAGKVKYHFLPPIWFHSTNQGLYLKISLSWRYDAFFEAFHFSYAFQIFEKLQFLQNWFS